MLPAGCSCRDAGASRCLRRSAVFLFPDQPSHISGADPSWLTESESSTPPCATANRPPGWSFSADEKLQIARLLERMGVDCIEAGFAAASPADFDAVHRIAREVRGTQIATLCRAVPNDVDQGWEAIRDAEAPRLHVFLSSSDIHIAHQLRKDRESVLEQARAMVAQAKRHVDDVEFSPMDATRSDVDFVRRDAGGGDRGGGDDDQHPGHCGLRDSGRVRGVHPGHPGGCAGRRQCRRVGALPQRSGAEHGEQSGGGAGRGAAGGMHDQRSRRAGRATLRWRRR